MQQSFSQFIAWLPEGTVWIIPLTLFLLLAGWISSITLAVKNKWLTLFAVFPLTNPLAVIGLMYKNTTASLIPVGFYTLALIVWFGGSSRSYKIESKRLIEYESKLIEQGEPIHASDYVMPKGNPEENAWEHPFLKPLALAGQPGPEGKEALKNVDQKYEKLVIPRSRKKIRYEEADTERLPMFKPARSILEAAVRSNLSSDQKADHEKFPTTPEEAARDLLDFLNQTKPDLEQLQEALSRPNDVYPFAWTQGFNLLLPHLSKMKNFSQITHMHSIANSILGDGITSFENTRLAFQLSQTGDSDILISRLVQIAQQIIALETLVAAQNHHAWNETQWMEVKEILENIDMIQIMPDSLRSERALGRASIEPLMSQTWTEAMRTISRIDGGGGPDGIEGFLKATLNVFGSNFSRAFLTKQWRLCQEAYSFMIDDLEKAAEASKTDPWRDVQVSWQDKDLNSYGLLASMLLPALDKAQSKAVLHQAKIELAKTTVDLERYFLRHKEYPSSLEDLVPDFTDSTPLDPMTRKPYAYKRLSKASFEIYSTGLNGKDEEGRHSTKHRRGEAPPPDDLLWIVGELSSEFPNYTAD